MKMERVRMCEILREAMPTFAMMQYICFLRVYVHKKKYIYICCG